MRAAACRAVGFGGIALVEQVDVSAVEMRRPWDVVVLRAVGGKEYELRTFISGMQIAVMACRGL
jgi:hypothetical protein